MKAIDRREFAAGVRWWRTETRWPSDFHNAAYATLAAQNPDGAFDDDWWVGFLPRLARWNALRPFSKAEVTDLLIANRDDLTSAWHQACASVKDKDITEVAWEQVRAFPEVVARLKPTKSSVFRSKFCHFLLPRIFPVFDNEAVGGSYTYEMYFNLVKSTWEVTTVDLQASLIAELTQLVEDETRSPLYPGFPMATKITELALIGHKHLPGPADILSTGALKASALQILADDLQLQPGISGCDGQQVGGLGPDSIAPALAHIANPKLAEAAIRRRCG